MGLLGLRKCWLQYERERERERVKVTVNKKRKWSINERVFRNSKCISNELAM